MTRDGEIAPLCVPVLDARQLKGGECSRIIRWLGEKKLKDLSDETLDAWYGILIQFERKGE